MATALTDTLRVVSLLKSGADGTSLDNHNELLETLVVEISDSIERYLHRTILETAHTEYCDGTGTSTLLLREGPLVSVASVDCVEYVDGGSGARSETLTRVDPYLYVEDGQRSEGCTGAGSLRLISGCWTKGRRNYKVVYTAGWGALDSGSNEIPEAIVHQATREVAARFNTRSMDGLSSRTLGDASAVASDAVSIPQRYLDEARGAALASFRLRRVG